jgi:asparagine synthase (glutamine-hydrolysing)
MCGIAGQVSTVVDENLLEKVNKIQSHRGPNSQQFRVYNTGNWKTALCHQRLSIIDLAEHANQPFIEGNITLVYNGEVYNYIEIRDELEQLGHHFNTNSDTEVVLKSIKEFGLEKATSKFNGMWALAYLDQAKNELLLSRDRFGIKPLYYYKNNNNFIFESEIKSILLLSQTKFTINKQVVGEYIDQSILEGNQTETFFNEVLKLSPGHNIKIDLSRDFINVELEQYYNLKVKDLSQKTDSELIKQVREQLSDAVKLRLRSDVPVGVLLSGGLDSSSIASITANVNGDQTKLLSYVSNSPELDESKFIGIMANFLKKEVTKVQIEMNPSKVLSILEDITFLNDQPLHSFSALAHYLLMEKARQNGLTVILSGQGADETLCGYRKYTLFYAKLLLSKGKLFKLASLLFGFVSNGTILNEFSLKDAQRYLPGFLKKKKKSILSKNLIKFFKPQNIGLPNGRSIQWRQIRDIKYFSVPSLLHYEDRMSMANSREVRVPFLDHNVVELFLSLPMRLKLSKGWTKFALREAMGESLPDSIRWRKDKKGFTSPQKEWLQNQMRDEITKIFKSKSSLIYKFDLIDQVTLQEKYQEFCSTSRISEREIFAPLALELWLRVNAQSLQ